MKNCVATLILAITLLILTGCASVDSKKTNMPQVSVTQAPVPQPTMPKVTVPKGLDTYSGLSAALAAGENIQLYDVRNTKEYESGHIPGALNIPHHDIAWKLPASRKNNVIVLYCVTGVRSYAARQWLISKGFNYVIDFGGLGKWDGELVKGSDQYISK